MAVEITTDMIEKAGLADLFIELAKRAYERDLKLKEKSTRNKTSDNQQIEEL